MSALLPTVTSAAVAKAQANTPQWQTYKAELDRTLDSAESMLAAWRGSAHLYAQNYALGYHCLKDSDPATAAKYAQKALGLLNAAIDSSDYNFDSGKKFIAQGDGKTTTFTIPDASFVPGSLVLYLNDVAVSPVVKGSAGGADFYGAYYDLPIRVVGSNDLTAPAAYTKGTDWRIDTSLYPALPPKPRPDVYSGNPYGHRLIDWSPAGTEPATGSTYYVVHAYLLDGFHKLTLGTDYKVSGTTITFATPPPANKAIWAEYLYTDADGNGYAQTSNGLGGMTVMYTEDGWPSRVAVALIGAANLLDDFAGYTPTRKAAHLDQFKRWSDFLRDYAYAPDAPLNNYGGAHMNFRACFAVHAEGRGLPYEATLKSEVLGFYHDLIVPALTTIDSSVRQNSTMRDGYHPDGWHYGQEATMTLMLAALTLEDAGWVTIPEARQVAQEKTVTDLYTHSYYGGPSGPAIVDPRGDGYFYPAVGPRCAWPEQYYVLAHMSADPTIKAWANHLIQDYPYFDGRYHPAPNNHRIYWYWLCFCDPTAPASTALPTTLPLSRHVRGAGLIYARDGWTLTTDTVVSFHCGNMARNGHQPYEQGNLLIQRGPDDLLVLPTSVKMDQTFQRQSQYSNSVVIDSSIQTYPTGNDGPAQATMYGSPDHNITIDHYEEAKGYIYWRGDYHHAYYNANNNLNPVSQLNREVLYLPALNYVFVFDRVTKEQASYTGQLQWSFNPAAKLNRDGAVWDQIRGSSRLWANGFGATTSGGVLDLTSADGVITGEANCLQVTHNPATATSSYGYKVALQVTASTGTQDTAADIASTYGICCGLMRGNAAAVWSLAGDLPECQTVSYTATHPSGQTITHHVCNLYPGGVYQVKVNGSPDASVTASAQGVATFTTTGTGSPQVVTLASSTAPLPPPPPPVPPPVPPAPTPVPAPLSIVKTERVLRVTLSDGSVLYTPENP